ncbi:MAG TPA: hypothetical protein VKZ18_11680 [Polyangia bacterium]|nr:hypothetical protein [Polyangia bacterium]
MGEATYLKIYPPNREEPIEYKADPTKRLRVRVEGDTVKIDLGETVEQFTRMPFRIVWKKTSPGPAW